MEQTKGEISNMKLFNFVLDPNNPIDKELINKNISSKELDPEYSKVVDDNFWDLIWGIIILKEIK